MSDSSGVNSSDENDDDDDDLDEVELASEPRLLPRLEMVVDIEPRMASRREAAATLAERGRWRPWIMSLVAP